MDKLTDAGSLGASIGHFLAGGDLGCVSRAGRHTASEKHLSGAGDDGNEKANPSEGHHSESSLTEGIEQRAEDKSKKQRSLFGVSANAGNDPRIPRQQQKAEEDNSYPPKIQINFEEAIVRLVDGEIG
jgi:hypothetical protein